MASKSGEEKYTDPQLREGIKEEIRRSDKGGKEGQWSARKSQLLTREYERRGGGYRGEKDASQKNLQRWTGEEWQTREGGANARGGGDETKRYLPKEAWEKMSDEEKEETEKKKREGSRRGEQYVPNTAGAKDARKGGAPVEGYDGMAVGKIKEKLGLFSEGDLEQVRSYEKGHKGRKTLLEWLDRKIEARS
jgi:hypothetical protein